MIFGKQQTDEERKQEYEKRLKKVEEREARTKQAEEIRNREKSLYAREHPNQTRFKEGFKKAVASGGKELKEYIKHKQQKPQKQQNMVFGNTMFHDSPQFGGRKQPDLWSNDTLIGKRKSNKPPKLNIW